MIKKIINFGLVGVFATAIEYILLIVLIVCFSYGVVGTVGFHRWRKGKSFNDKKITKYILLCRRKYGR